MNSKILGARLLISSALAVGALTPLSASATLRPGNYVIAGVQPICLIRGGTWYGESYAFNGRWIAGPTGQTAIFGNYNTGAGNDSMVVTVGAVLWTEWSDDLSYQNIVTGTVTRISGRCTIPAVAKPGHRNPMD
ncbi:MAG: hypothetical protein ABI306_10435 [Caulobacteraceae bacterium]